MGYLDFAIHGNLIILIRQELFNQDLWFDILISPFPKAGVKIVIQPGVHLGFSVHPVKICLILANQSEARAMTGLHHEAVGQSFPVDIAKVLIYPNGWDNVLLADNCSGKLLGPHFIGKIRHDRVAIK